ncbi:MAG: heme-binding domain-containing protein [Acidimicrobiales bacterium]
MNRSAAWRAVRGAGLGGLVLFGAIQLVPYGWRHSNPAITQDAPWPDAEAERIARSSCYACHSNETDWPLYSYVAPMSWLVRRDVESGRDKLNFSEWEREDGDADKAIETILEGSKAPDRYTMIHRDARLTDAEADRLVAALEALEGQRGDGNGGRDAGLMTGGRGGR